MKILTVNDDGIEGKGLISLGKTIHSMGHELVIVAPEREMSCTSHSITFNNHLNYKPHKIIDGVESYAISGTPVDCVKFGIHQIMKEKPDLIISGINTTCNIGTDVLYSGTVSAAIEGSILGVKSIALSYNCDDGEYGYVCDFVKKNLTKLVDLMPNSSSILNINFPFYPNIKGVKFCSTGERRFADYYVYDDTKGYYIMGDPIKTPNELDSDVVAFDEGNITISPIKVDFTDYKLLSRLKEINL